MARFSHKNKGKAKRGKLTGQGMTPNAIYQRVELLRRKIGIDGLSPPDLRYTFAEAARGTRASDGLLLEA